MALLGEFRNTATAAVALCGLPHKSCCVPGDLWPTAKLGAEPGQAWPGLDILSSCSLAGWRQDYVVTFCQSTVAIQLDLNAVNTAALITNNNNSNNNSHATTTRAARAAAAV